MVPVVLSTDVPEVARALGDAATAMGMHDVEAAIMWINRAAQIAGQAGDDERALVLALAATELVERHSSGVVPVARKHDESAVTAELEVGTHLPHDTAATRK